MISIHCVFERQVVSSPASVWESNNFKPYMLAALGYTPSCHGKQIFCIKANISDGADSIAPNKT